MGLRQYFDNYGFGKKLGCMLGLGFIALAFTAGESLLFSWEARQGAPGRGRRKGGSSTSRGARGGDVRAAKRAEDERRVYWFKWDGVCRPAAEKARGY